MRRLVFLVLAACAGTPAVERHRLPAPHRQAPTPTALRRPIDLQARIGVRDKRDPIAAVLAWAGELGKRVDAESGADLLAWAERTQRLRSADEPAQPGDLLVFDRTRSGEAADLVGIAIGRDARGVTEIVYLAGGVVRRGFVDATRPALRRDRDGAIVNTYLRHGKRVPRSRQLAGALLANVVRMH